jgi:predicted nucleic acid-binding protein
LFSLKKKGELIISVINVVEIYSGKEIKDLEKKEVIDDFLSGFEIILLDENLAKFAGEIRLNYQLPFTDAIIAVVAIKTNSILVTGNIKDIFQKLRN